MKINCYQQKKDYFIYEMFPSGSVVKYLLANAGTTGDAGLIPGLRRSPGEGYGYPLRYSWLGNPMDKRSRWAIVHGVAK